MRRSPLPCVLLAIVLAGSVAPTRAQDEKPRLIVKRDGEVLADAPFRYATKADCDTNASYEFSTRYPDIVNVVEAWLGAPGVSCSDQANRLRSATTVRSICKLVGRSSKASSTPSISVDAATLFARGDEPGCDEVVNANYTLYFIPLPQPTDSEANKTYSELDGPGYGTLSATFSLFSILPDAPDDLLPQDGASKVAVRFVQGPNTTASTRFRAYFDWRASDDQPCGSGALVAGAPAPSEGDTIAAVTTRSDVAELRDLDRKRIAPGTELAVAVTAVDAAGNESLLSAPVCVTRLAGEAPRTVRACSAGPAARGLGAYGGGVWLLAALFVSRRRALRARE